MPSKKVVDAILREDLHTFIVMVFKTLNPGTEFKDNWHLHAIAYSLMRVATGDIKRLVITLPPRHMKSLSASIAFVAWMLGKFPTKRIICASYGNDLAVKFSLDTRKVMTAPWYRRAFAKFKLDSAKQTQGELHTTLSGFRYATSVGGALTGIGGDILILDDPLKAEDAHSETQLEKVIEWYKHTASTRLDDKENGAIVVIQQRLHENDLAGYLLSTGTFEHLNLPAVAREAEDIPIGPKAVHHRAVGDVLHPERESKALLLEIRKQIGSMAFAAQYLQEPTPPDGAIFKRKWFKKYKTTNGTNVPTPKQGDQIIQSWDVASTVNESSNFSVCTTWMMRGNEAFLLDVFRAQLEFPALKQKARELARKYKAHALLVEAVGVGLALFQELQGMTSLPIIPIRPEQSKVERAIFASLTVEARQVLVYAYAPWLSDFFHEVLRFPKGKHDDIVDSMTQFLVWHRKRIFTPRIPEVSLHIITSPRFSRSDLLSGLR